MRVLILAVKDWMQIFRDWKSALFLIAMPLLFTMFFGVVLGGAFNSGSNGDPRLPVGVIFSDQTDLEENPLKNFLEGSDTIHPEFLADVEEGELMKLVADEEFTAGLLVPAGYQGSLITESPQSLTVIVDRSNPAGQTALTALETVSNRYTGAVRAALLSAEAYQNQVGFEDQEARLDYIQVGVDLAVKEWQSPPLEVRGELATGEIEAAETAESLDGFVQASSGMIVQFAVFGLINSAMILVLERKSRTLQRLLTTPITRAEVIAGHLFAMFVVVLLQETVLVLFGQFVFGVNYLREPSATLVMMLALAFWSASLGLLISAVSRDEEQVVTLSLIAMFLFASLGGAWFPLEVAGETFSRIGHLTPTAWAIDGFQNIILRGQGLSSTLLPAGILIAYGLVFFVLSVRKFRFDD
ncbi:MAG: ABC transporter permease [Anaerolineales bacterium]|nr:ABC transporter permease [Anaerolineales bacterium]